MANGKIMLRVKKLYIFVLQSFLPQFMMTFFICLFIVMMQFLWGHIDDLVGKGLSIALIAELLFYAAMSLVPMALPLSILLASLMTFGNLGEHVELTAIKSSGISLVQVMKPLFVLITLLAIGAFFFQNNVLPQSQVKMWTLLFSMRQKSPTLDIPEGTVYTQIPGYNLYVKRKGDEHSGMLYNMLIYDVSSGTSYPRIVAADSGRLSITNDQKHLKLELYQGNWYEDMRGNSGTAGMGSELYRRESFHDKTILIPYDVTFSRMDDETMRQQYVGKDMDELLHTIDSVKSQIDSAGNVLSTELKLTPMCGVPRARMVLRDKDTVSRIVPVKPVTIASPVDFEALVNSMPPVERNALVGTALGRLVSHKQEYEFRGYTISEDNYLMRRHQIELQKKFTLSLACIIFFLIGAPLGAIIRKGGLGTPIVISVLMFIFYYIIDNSGYKLARDGRWPVWQGIWLSSAVLLPLGVFLTHKAINDSAVFNPDVWLNVFRRLTGTHATRKLEMKEVIINEVETSHAITMAQRLKSSCLAFTAQHNSPQGYVDYWRHGIDRQTVEDLGEQADELADYLSNSRSQMVLNKGMDLPVIRRLLIYRPTAIGALQWAMMLLVPVGAAVYLVARRYQRQLITDVRITANVCDQLKAILDGSYTREMEYQNQDKTE